MNKEIVINDFKNIIGSIKKDIDNTRIVAIQHVNRELIMLYFRIGKILENNSKYGNSLIKSLSIEIRIDYPNISGFFERNLKRMKRIYNEYKTVIRKCHSLWHSYPGDIILCFLKKMIGVF